MKLTKLTLAAAGLAVGIAGAAVTGAWAAEGQFIPGTQYRTGPYAPNGTPFANGYADYIQMLNARDGGIGGVPLVYEECETGYNTDRGVECYERLKKPTAAAFVPLSTGITYALIDRATNDKIPVFSSGYGRTAAGDGRVFPYIFTAPLSYWAGADVIMQYIKEQEKGSLKGKKIALVYHDSAYGKEPIATLEALSKKEGFQLDTFPVAHPGLEQKATWLKIGRRLKPDWVVMWGWGVMNSTAIKEAANVGFPMDKFIGIWWSSAEPDVRPAGDQAKGYKGLAFHATGTNFPAIQDILKLVHDKNQSLGPRDGVGEVLYMRGLFNAMVVAEAIRTAQGIHGKKVLTGEQIRDGFEALNITAERMKEIGLPGFVDPIKVTCTDHEGGGKAFVQQWDGAKWNKVSKWYTPNRDGLIRPMIEEAAAEYAKEKSITPRACK